MNNKIILLLVLLTFLATIAVFFVTSRKTFPLISPVLRQETREQPSPSPSVVPTTPSYNPPKEIHYGSATNLKAELESINPQVLESDFE